MVRRDDHGLHIMGIALGGCVRAEPVAYGITEDTGGHITYLLGAMEALAARPDVACAEIVTRLIVDRALGTAYAVPREGIAPGLSITRIDSGNRAYLSKDALAADRPAFIAALIAELEERDRLPDLVHAHFADAAEVALALRERFGIPFVYTAHSLGIDKARTLDRPCPKLTARIAEENRAVSGADAVIGSSRDECERQLVAYDDARVATIERLRPGIVQQQADEADLAAARALVAPFLRDPGKPLVLAIARPVEKKNLAALVEAFGAHPDLRERANLAILPGLRSSIERGEPEQVAVMRGLVDAIDRHDLHGAVAWPRRHTRAEVRGLYALARESGGVFVNPALVEPYGLTIVEAAVHGVPVVATREGGPVDIVAELEHGLLVNPRDNDAIGTAITSLLDDPERWRECSANGAERVRAMDWNAYADGFVRIARPLVSPRALPAIETLLLSDIDNTLTGCRDGVAAFARMLRAKPGLGFGVATGRSLSEARRVLRDWCLPETRVLASSVGSEIYWRRDGRLIADSDYADAIADGWDADAVVAALDGIEGLRPQPAIEQRAFKRSWFADGAGAVRAVRIALDRAGLEARIVLSHGDLLDVLPARAGKGAALRHIARVLGLPRERVIAAGDSGNDADMLGACANPVLVANCEPVLRSLALPAATYRSAGDHASGVVEGVEAHLARIGAGAASARREAA